MSTITKEFTKEQLIEQAKKNIEVLRGAVEKIPGSSDAAVIHLKLAEITLASLEAEPVAYMTYKGYLLHAADPKLAEYSEPTPLYDAPPAPVSVPDEVTTEDCPAFVKYDVTDVDEAWSRGFNACRTAMLQGAENAGSPTTMKTALALDSSPKIAESPSGNSPVIQDGWVACSERMPTAGQKVLAYRPDAPESDDPLIRMATFVGRSAHGHGFDCCCKPTHWMPLPAAPQQEDE